MRLILVFLANCGLFACSAALRVDHEDKVFYMILRQLIAGFAFVSLVVSKSIDVPATPTPDGNALTIDLNEEHSIELLQHWLDQALSGLMAAVATKRLDNASNKTKVLHEHCSKNASSVTAHARCVVRLFDDSVRKVSVSELDTRKIHALPIKERRLRRRQNRRKVRRIFKKKKHLEPEWQGAFKLRRKRSIAVSHRSSYELQSANKSPLASVAGLLTDTVRQLKKKQSKKNWKELVSEIKTESKRLKAQRLIQKMFKKRLTTIQEDVADGKINSRRPLAMKDMDELDEEDPKSLMAMAKKLMSNMTDEQKVLRAPLKLIRDVVRIGMTLGGHNMTDFDEKTLKLISPKMLSLTPEDDDGNDVNLLSPSLFALHNEGKGVEKLTNLADGFGLAKGNDDWLNFIMEAAGVTDAVEMLKEEKLNKRPSSILEAKDEALSPSGQPLFFTRDNVTRMFGEKDARTIDVFEHLQKTYTTKQAEEQRTRGYSLMTKEQLLLIYGPGSPYADPDRLRLFANITEEALPGHIENNVRALAEMDKFAIRKKDVILLPVVGIPLVFVPFLLSGPVILSPLVFSPVVLSPAVLGPVILSPWVFIPVILSPRALSPLILNPLIFSPIVLSPLLLHPLILSPGVFNPIVLSPLALSPFILSPQVFTPIILSPFALNPLILNPEFGSPVVLSPFVLSPLIRSTQVLFALVLSPHALSPLIDTELIWADVVASPSVLS